MLVIGSKALRRYNKKREFNDIDIIGTIKEINFYIDFLSRKDTYEKVVLSEIIQLRKDGELKYEFFIATQDNVMGDYAKCEGAYNTGVLKYATKYTLYSIKKGHLFHTKRLNKFKKHIKDYEYLNDICYGKDIYDHLTKKQSQETESRGSKLVTPKLDKSSESFFNESSEKVDYRFIHDDIHDIMAHGDKPRYTLMQNKGQKSAFCYKDMWENMSTQHKLECVLEEAYVIALERKLIPAFFDKRYSDPMIALDWSLMRICTNLCSGWFRKFACDNHTEIRRLINKNYHKIFFQAYRQGKILEGNGKLIQN